MKPVCKNKRAFHDYTIDRKIEAGLSLLGSEVKSLREHRANLKGAFCRIENGEGFVCGMHISEYPQAGQFNHDPVRKRKLLLHHREIFQLQQAIEKKGMTVVPLSVYFKKGYAKMEIAVARGKRKYDKRDKIKRKEDIRNIRSSMMKHR